MKQRIAHNFTYSVTSVTRTEISCNDETECIDDDTDECGCFDDVYKCDSFDKKPKNKYMVKFS